MFCRVEPSGIQLWGSISPTRIESMPVNRARPRKERWHVWVFLHSHQTSEHVNVLISQGIVEMLKFSGNTDMLLFFYSCPDQIPDSGQKNLQKKRWFSIIWRSPLQEKCCRSDRSAPPCSGLNPVSIQQIQKLDFLAQIERPTKVDASPLSWWDWSFFVI